MLSIGWTEMMVVAAVALIVVGPKDLPGMLRQLGRAMGSIRRMGNEFKAELNKVTAVDDLKEIKRSIAAPLKETRQKIEDEFNAIAPDGKVAPSGKISPADPETESVVDQIRDTSGLAKSGARAADKNTGAAKKVTTGKKTTSSPRPTSKKNSTGRAKAAKSCKTEPGKTKSATTEKASPGKRSSKKPAVQTSSKEAS